LSFTQISLAESYIALREIFLTFMDFCLKNFCGKNKNLAISWRAAFFILKK